MVQTLREGLAAANGAIAELKAAANATCAEFTRGVDAAGNEACAVSLKEV